MKRYSDLQKEKYTFDGELVLDGKLVEVDKNFHVSLSNPLRVKTRQHLHDILIVNPIYQDVITKIQELPDDNFSEIEHLTEIARTIAIDYLKEQYDGIVVDNDTGIQGRKTKSIFVFPCDM